VNFVSRMRNVKTWIADSFFFSLGEKEEGGRIGARHSKPVRELGGLQLPGAFFTESDEREAARISALFVYGVRPVGGGNSFNKRALPLPHFFPLRVEESWSNTGVPSGPHQDLTYLREVGSPREVIPLPSGTSLSNFNTSYIILPFLPRYNS
jgi:hypothetical protein